jgi:hypothetical protein
MSHEDVCQGRRILTRNVGVSLIYTPFKTRWLAVLSIFFVACRGVSICHSLLLETSESLKELLAPYQVSQSVLVASDWFFRPRHTSSHCRLARALDTSVLVTARDSNAGGMSRLDTGSQPKRQLVVVVEGKHTPGQLAANVQLGWSGLSTQLVPSGHCCNGPATKPPQVCTHRPGQSKPGIAGHVTAGLMVHANPSAHLSPVRVLQTGMHVPLQSASAGPGMHAASSWHAKPSAQGRLVLPGRGGSASGTIKLVAAVAITSVRCVCSYIDTRATTTARAYVVTGALHAMLDTKG